MLWKKRFTVYSCLNTIFDKSAHPSVSDQYNKNDNNEQSQYQQYKKSAQCCCRLRLKAFHFCKEKWNSENKS